MDEEEDKKEGMGYILKDPKTGKEQRYEVSYSQKLQEKIDKELKKSNKLKIAILILGVVVLIAVILVGFRTGVVGYFLRRMVCPI